ncbi:MAG: hypothetical protein JWP60_64 [Ramlibacter sp.]|nr:hypothetical protein [Ramlibacter sp.]
MPTNGNATRTTAASLNAWVDAHRALMDEEADLVALARKVACQESPVAVLQQQQIRVVALQKQVEDLYDGVMAELANPARA